MRMGWNCGGTTVATAFRRAYFCPLQWKRMQRSLIVAVMGLAVLTACTKKSSPSESTKSGDAVQQQLQQSAGNGATDCGRLQSQAPDQLKKASDCALQAAQGKKPFYVAYDMPGMTVGVAGNSEGKFFYVSAQGGENGAAPDVKSGPCEADLRIAQSGRVTCFAPGSMGPAGGVNPHSGGGMSTGTQNPHEGGMMMPPGTPNPHEGGGTGMGASHGNKAAKPPTQQR